MIHKGYIIAINKFLCGNVDHSQPTASAANLAAIQPTTQQIQHQATTDA
ncbi:MULTISPECIES: hypothetical protein [Serratia]|nr:MULTISPECIES: hypothetical protein [Serratia]UAN49771.1 hypothetical protein KGP26_18635 [Serratia sp. JSRIV002]UAN61368.1 hypothetical protein KGP16_17335 [Serratia sp. JSRIV006]